VGIKIGIEHTNLEYYHLLTLRLVNIIVLANNKQLSSIGDTKTWNCRRHLLQLY